MRKPREYQEEAIKAIMKEFDSGIIATLLIMGTGLGKTVVFSILSRLREGRCLFLAHRTELIKQAKDKLLDANPDDIVEIEQGQFRATAAMRDGIGGRLVVASKDTLCSDKRLLRFSPNEFSTLVVDEAHRAVKKNKTYWSIIKRFAAPPIGEGTAKVLFVTATAKRADGEALGGIVQSVAYERSLADGIQDGYLVGIKTKQLIIDSVDVDLRGVKTTTNEFGEKDISAGDLARIAKSEKYIMQVAKPVYEIANQGGRRRSTVIFMPSVWSAEQVAAALNRFRPGCAACVSGSMTEDRSKILKGFEAGRIQFLCNCDVLTEGWDCDRVEIVVPRMTMSEGKFAQMIGRGTRPLNGCVDIWETAELRREAILNSPKPHLLVLDTCGVTSKVRLVSAVDIFSGNYSPEVVSLAKDLANKKEITIDEALREAKAIKKREAEERLREVKAQVNYHLNSVDLFKHFGLRNVGTWCPPQFFGKMATPNQVHFIERRGVKVADGLTFYQAKKIIEGITKNESTMRASESQVKTLLRFGIDPNISYSEAAKMIKKIADSGWKRPEGIPHYKPDIEG